MASRFSGVYNRMSGIFKPNRGEFKAEQYRMTLMGLVLACTMNEVLSYMLLRKSVEVGEVPYVFLVFWKVLVWNWNLHPFDTAYDLVFGSISFVSVLALPFLCWVGSARRVTVMTTWLLLSVVFIFPLFFMPFNNRETSELCNAVSVAQGSLSALAAFRLVVIIALAFVNSLAGSSVWAHGMAVADVYSPGTVAMDLALILGFRAFLMTAGFEIMYDMIQNRFYLQLAILIPHPLVSIYLLRRSYDNTMMAKDDVEDYNKGSYGFFTSFASVLTNRWAMLHTFLMALLVTGLWGFILNDYEAAKAKYLIPWTFNVSNNILVAGPGFLIILFMKLNGYDYSSPFVNTFNKSSATVNSIKQTARAMVGLLVIAIIGCNKAAIEGVTASGYNVPNCSFGCGCRAPASEFNPICMVNTLTTYFSPCHAGCQSTVDVNNATVYTNCSCSGTSRAIPGACLNADCETKYTAHQLIFALVITFALIAIMMQMMLVLRSVRAREKSIALGIAFSITALVAFVGGHLGYRGIAMHTCLFWDGGKCQLQSDSFGTLIYSLSIGIFGLASIINVFVWILYRRQQSASKKTIEDTTIED